MPFVATWMDLKITILSEVKSDRGKTNTWYHLYVELKYDTNELIQKTETDSQTQKINLWLPKGKRGSVQSLSRDQLFVTPQTDKGE